MLNKTLTAKYFYFSFTYFMGKAYLNFAANEER